MKEINRVFKYLILFSFILSIIPNSYGIDAVIGGYIKNLQSGIFIDHDADWALGNTLNARINAKLYFSENLSWTLGGNIMFICSNYLDMYTDEQKGNFINFHDRDISAGYISNSYLMRAFMDRNYFEYLGINSSISLGYQRINWGMNLAWNPNDIFNAYSIYDFDYEERPGILSLRGRYYTSPLSSFDIVISSDDIYGANYRTNIRAFDIQFIGGYSENEIIIGTGFEGQIFKGGLRGELTVFTDNDDFNHIFAITGDYTFKNSLYIHLGYLYNSYGHKESALLNKLYPEHDNPAKNLSAGKQSILLEFSYTLSPLLTASMTSITNILDNSFFISPMITYSWYDDLELIILSQLNFGDSLDEYSKELGKAFFIRLRYSF